MTTMTAAVDVGGSTGIVIAEMDFHKKPLLKYAFTCPSRTAILSPDWAKLRVMGELYREEVEFILVEYPHVLNNMPNKQEMLEYREFWKKFIEDYRANNYKGTIVVVKEILPATWKQTPAKGAFLPKQGLSSKHEKDAYRMIFWASFYMGLEGLKAL